MTSVATKTAASTLWAVSIQGPDDLIAVASYAEAIGVANLFNDFWEKRIAHAGLHEYAPRMWAIPVEYPNSAESHAEWLAKPSSEYEFFIAGYRRKAGASHVSTPTNPDNGAQAS